MPPSNQPHHRETRLLEYPDIDAPPDHPEPPARREDQYRYDQQQAEAALRASEGRFRALIEKSFDAITLMAADGSMRYVSPSCVRIVGYKPEELVGRNAFDLVHPEDRAPLQALLAGILQQPGGVASSTCRSQHKDGSWRWMDATATNLLAEPEVAAVVVNFRDITEQREASDQLVQAQERSAELLALLETLLHNAPIGFGFVGRDLRFRRVNTALAVMNRLPAADHVGRTVEEVVPDIWPGVEPIYRSILAGGEPMTNIAVTRRTGAGGEARHWLVSYYPVRTSSELIGVGVIVNDVTEANQLEEQYRQAQKMEAVGRLAGGVAHDFNNLLTVIGGYCDVLLVTPGSQDARQLLEGIQKAAERAATLTRQLLAFGRKQILQPRVLDLNGLITDIRDMLARMIGEDVQLVCALAPQLALLRADVGQLEQVLINLAANARDAMPNGGTLTIETANVRLHGAETEVLARPQPGCHVRLTVRDTGVGMDARTQARVFEPFFTTKALGKGTGLGLATVYGIVKQSGGQIQVSSEVGVGSAFHVYFPAIEETLPARTVTPEPVAVPGGNETILLAEDQHDVRELTVEFLQHAGYRVLAAADGLEALKIAAAERGAIDLLVTDVVMPGMSGRELAEALRCEHSHLRVLYLSGYTEDAVVRHGVLESEVAFLQKPFMLAQLATRVRAVLDAAG